MPILLYFLPRHEFQFLGAFCDQGRSLSRDCGIDSRAAVLARYAGARWNLAPQALRVVKVGRRLLICYRATSHRSHLDSQCWPPAIPWQRQACVDYRVGVL